MSTPVASFKKLSISDLMETTEPQGRKVDDANRGSTRYAPEDDETSSEASSSEEEDSDGDEGNGNTHVLALDHCRQIGSRYAFQVVDAEVRRCGIRLDETMNIPYCSCNGGAQCRHTQWLLAELAKVRRSSPTKKPLSPHAYITSKGLGSICKTLKWELRDASDDEAMEYPWALKKDYAVQAPEEQTEQNRTFIVRDMLASFSNTPTDEFRNDIFNTVPGSSVGDVYLPNDLQGTIARVLLHDDEMFDYFNTLIKPDTRATKYFQNMALKAQRTLTSLENYCEGGPSQAGGDFDLIWCAQSLTEIVNTISHNLSTRQPLSSATRTTAAKTLISILSTVIKSRNHDVYQNLSWPRPRKHGEPQIDRNLYQRLIGSTAPANPSGGTFVIKALQDLPEAKAYIDSLEECVVLLESVGWSAPKQYVDRLKELCRWLKGVSGPSPSSGSPGSSGGKRAGDMGMEGKVKRMK